jgi:acyl-CoA thioester hydrolase
MNKERKFIHRLRVRYQETDQMGVVYHANYLNWFEITRTEWIRELGIPYSQMEEKGLLLPVTEVQLKYIQPARYDDLIEVHLRMIDSSHLRVIFQYEVFREQDKMLLITGTTRHVWVNRDWKPVRLDRVMPELHQLINDDLKSV